MDKAVIQGTFADLKSVKTRSVVQMVVEIPIEQAEQVIKAFGFPQPGAEIAVAVARMDPKTAKAPPAPTEKPKKRFHELPLSQQAALRCRDEDFWSFADQRDEQSTIGWLYEKIGVESRREFDKDAFFGQRWSKLNAEYEQWSGQVAEAR